MPSKTRTKSTTKIEKNDAAAAPETAANKLEAVLVAAPGSTAADLAVSVGINKSTAGKILARWEAAGTAVRTAGEVIDGRRAGDLWSAVVPEVVTEQEPVEAVVPVRKPSDSLLEGRLKPGALRGLTEDYLRMHPGEAFGPTHIGRVLGRSQGAVNNALEALTSSGTVVKTQEAPKRFAIAPTATR
ncbi:MarR family transcriptional regulator [Lentzea cavernae]|uniref:MarR family transcriptional regulator n=1 Tax=Lentzea cavernae TaxID=2020703 RepID=A0ABQ3M396_9PSEU|nr:helix-turn-helix domain-containing protein [Lentzea cavernae]GHH32197.1 hypothetical protein GCM10017774_12740 [Lentzea cavernae]